jgi:hypothetical protein
MEFIQEIIDYEGLPASIHVTSSRYEGVTLTVRGSKEELLGQVQLKPILHGYQVLLQKGDFGQFVPFIDQTEKGELLRDILPAYRGVLSGRTYAILLRPNIRELPVSEFLEILGNSAKYEAFYLGPHWRGGRHEKTLQKMSCGIGLKTIQELVRVFLVEGNHDGK